MKLNHIIPGVMALALASLAQADVSVDITGATAFRGAANQAILNAFLSQGALGTTFNYTHEATAGQLNNANRAIFRGTFPGISGVTTIRTSWNGSVEGIEAIALGGAKNPTFLAPSTLGTGEVGGVSAPTETVQPLMAFSDVGQASTPVTSPTLNGGPAGIITFAPFTNNGAPSGVTNITAQQFRALFTRGYQPLSMFTGDANDNPASASPNPGAAYLFITGRNDGSGTRTTYLAETGFGITKPVQQFVAKTSDASTISAIKLSPAGDATFKSVVWGQDLDGNGGYSSGSSLRDLFKKTTASCAVFDSDGTTQLLAAGQIYLVSWAGTGDVRNAITGGAKILAYNGEILDSLTTSSTLSVADIAKITEGKYSAWGFEQFLYRGTLTTDENAVYTTILNGIPAALGSSGIASSLMHVSRVGGDGGTVAP